MIRVLLADDEVILRDSLKYILERDSDIQVIDSVGNGFEALESCKKALPDLILMDIMMPVCDGVEGTRLIKSLFPSVRIIILTTFKDEEYVMNALKFGASGYLLKDIRAEELLGAVKNSASTLGTLHNEALSLVVNRITQHMNSDALKKANLTEREIEIIRQIVNGKSNREIASSLYLTEGSIKNSITVLLDRLKLNDRTQLAVFAVRNNIV